MNCAKCGGEIVPGRNVEVVTTEDLDERRIFTSDEVLFSHVEGECLASAEG